MGEGREMGVCVKKCGRVYGVSVEKCVGVWEK